MTDNTFDFERELWPVEGMKCDVEGCTTPIFRSFSIYMKHWKAVHNQFVPVYNCVWCKEKLARRCDVTRHLRFQHSVGQIDAKRIAEGVTPDRLHNMHFVDPGVRKPRRMPPKVYAEARDRAQKERREYAEAHHVDFPNLEGAVLVPRDRVAYVFHVPGLGQRLQLKPKSGWNVKCN